MGRQQSTGQKWKIEFKKKFTFNLSKFSTLAKFLILIRWGGRDKKRIYETVSSGCLTCYKIRLLPVRSAKINIIKMLNSPVPVNIIGSWKAVFTCTSAPFPS
jgi:hypothetical protein